jgi:hypothetical protein
MKIKAVKKAKSPEYPTIEHYVKNPQNFLKSIPKSWAKNKLLSGALATFVLCGFSGKDNASKSDATIEAIDKIPDNSNKDQHMKQEAVKDSVKVAPVFAHGDGSGAVGCVAVSAPVFITESEAKEIITSALKKENIVFPDSVLSFSFMSLPFGNNCYGYSNEKNDTGEVKVKLKYDGYNEKNNFAFFYISVDDYSRFSDSIQKCWSTVESYNTKKAAEVLREELAEQQKVNAVVFYDPIVKENWSRDNYEKSENKANEDARAMLLKQVEDFIRWYKKQGFLKK